MDLCSPHKVQALIKNRQVNKSVELQVLSRWNQECSIYKTNYLMVHIPEIK